MASPSASEGLRLLERGATSEAARAFTRGLEADPGDADCLRGLARARIAQGDLTEAEEHLRRLLAAHPEDLEGQSHLALLRATLGDEGAVASLKALAAAPGAGYAEHLNLGVVLSEWGDLEGAAAAWSGALAASPDSRTAHLELGKLALERGDADAAVAHLGAAARASPGEAPLLLLLSRAHARRGEMEVAIQLASEAARRAPRFSEPHEELLGLALRSGNPARAVVEAQALRALDPNSARYAFLHGLALLASISWFP